MSAERLNHYILHVHKTFTDELDLNTGHMAGLIYRSARKQIHKMTNTCIYMYILVPSVCPEACLQYLPYAYPDCAIGITQCIYTALLLFFLFHVKLMILTYINYIKLHVA